ncbi:AAA family ATPase [Laspinema sp. A4]|uniref:AAA family ATPase n=1 Tax=Laspinema sp. D2d TaxID=2953686 RepID=UPI0021BB9E8C|nr:AAA family ATPase [Laspinema sp. D2d]MCT7982385.1 AAA family ATPase [Laspinema sp. D2d]
MIPGYQILDLIYESNNSMVYRGVRLADHQPVILKLLKQDYPTPEELRRYQQEYEITHNLQLDGVGISLQLERVQNTPLIIFEDFGGESLAHWKGDRSLTLEEFLPIAIQVADCLEQIHAAHIIHKDINPANIVLNPQTGQVKIIDFGISTILSRENPTFSNPNLLEGTLPYISPEQTGRMNRAIDYRTDFYSLGVTFYELLTNRLPFESEEPLEWVHFHIAKQPVSLHEVNPSLPHIVEEIIFKLMAKTAEDRYQSARGLKADLEHCWHQLQTRGILLNFPLAGQDISDKFHIHQKLYGRESEIQTLLSAFDSVAAGEENSPSQMMLVSGYSGIGKSAIVHEIYKPITEKKGYFISGKFDQYQRDIPYSAFIQAFTELVEQLLTETEAQLQEWREKLGSQLGANLQVIIEAIAAVELIVGSQPPVPTLPPAESQNRFRLVFQNFIKIFSTPTHPLAIFLDDLQWADRASLDLIQLLINGSESGLFLIGAYRDNEVNVAHPLMQAIGAIRDNGATVNEIFLNPLGLPTVTTLIADTLHCDHEHAQPLAELVIDKTGGNPFFLTEFLKSLYTEGLLIFDYEQGVWQWDLEQIQAQEFSENVVELMAGKIQKLPEEAQNILKRAACLGNQFSLKRLALVCEKSPRKTASLLHFAIAEGLVLPLSPVGDWGIGVEEIRPPSHPERVPQKGNRRNLLGEYKFVHDRIQQAAYSLIPDSEKTAIHHQVGYLLLHHTPPHEQEEKLFEMVNALNKAQALIQEQVQRHELAQLNLRAGQKAKASAAYQPAFNYLKAGLELLAESSWQTHYDLTVSLYIEAAEAAYLCSEFVTMQQWGNEVLKRAKTLMDKVKVYEVKIQADKSQNNSLQAITTALDILKLLGIKFPKKPNKFHALQALIHSKFLFRGKQPRDLLYLPPISDRNIQAAMRILSNIAAAAYVAFPALSPLLGFKQFELSVKYGNTSESPHAYAIYATFICALMGDFEMSHQLGEVALHLLQQLNDKKNKAKTIYIVNCFLNPCKIHIRETLKPLLETYAIGLETGDLQYGPYGIYVYSIHAYFIGKELTQLEQEMGVYSTELFKLKQKSPLQKIQLYRQVVLNLIGNSENPSVLKGEAYDEETMLVIHEQANDLNCLAYLYLNKLILGYLFEQSDSLQEWSELTQRYLSGIRGMILVPIFYFYDSLIQLSQLGERVSSGPGSDSAKRKQILKKVATNQQKLQKFAQSAPMNYQHKFDLVKAEQYRILGEELKAINAYEIAIAGAKEQDYANEVALAYELAAKFYLANRRELTAKAYLQESRYWYLRWGATRKVKHLDETYPQLLRSNSLITVDSQKTISSPGKSSGHLLDLATILKATNALAGEILLDNLLVKLMNVLLENTGAEKGCLILKDKEELRVEASGAVDSDRITVLQSIPVDYSPDLSSMIVNYVARTKESVVLNHATQEGKFTNDPYIERTQPKSILCVPLIDRGQLISIAYLENNLTTDAFTGERVEVVKLLSAQAAIAIENAQLYAEIRASESRLAQFLEAMPVGVGAVDPQGKPQYVNRMAQELLGKGVAPNATTEQISEIYQLYRAGTNEIYPPEELPIVRALHGETTNLDNIEIHQGDKIIPIESRGTPIYDEKGNILYAIVAFQDITERKTAERERERLLADLSELNTQLQKALDAEEALTEAAQRFVPNQFLSFLGYDSLVDVKVGDAVQKEMSILFTDIRDFTTLSETMTPEENFKFINSYLSRMEPAILEHQGFIDKFIGDAIMALFGGDADDAVKAGLAMLNRLKEYNLDRAKSSYPPIQIGVGINTGDLMLGTVGGENRMDGTVISDAVNLASRVESLTKNYGVSLLITHHTFLRLKNPSDYAIRTIARVQVKGKSELVTVYEVFDADSLEVKAGKLATLELFSQGRSLYQFERWAEAASLFQSCLDQNPGDKVAQIYWQKCQELISNSINLI